MRRQQIDPRLIRFDSRPRPDPVGHGDGDLVGLAVGDLVVNRVPGVMGAIRKPESSLDRRPGRVVPSRRGHQQGVTDARRAEHHVVGKGLLAQQIEAGVVPPRHQRRDRCIRTHAGSRHATGDRQSDPRRRRSSCDRRVRPRSVVTTTRGGDERQHERDNDEPHASWTDAARQRFPTIWGLRAASAHGTRPRTHPLPRRCAGRSPAARRRSQLPAPRRRRRR